MTFVPSFPKKVQYLLSFSFPMVGKLCRKTPKEQFIGGRKGYDKEFLFLLLLIKRVTNWSYRTIGEMGNISHSTLVRANEYFLEKKIYEKVFLHLVKRAHRKGLIPGRFISLDASFVATFSGKEELGSEGWNDFKDAFGFKLHLLVDCETKFPLALCVTNGNASDNTLAIPLLKQAKTILRKAGYVVADKGYDDGDLVNWIVKELSAKAGIPIKNHKRGRNYSWRGSWRNFTLKAKGRSIKKSIYNRRSAIERVFSVLKRVYHLGKEEVRGILNFAKQVYLSLICYMLKLFNIVGISC
ncbi:transposase [Candidatus Gottesmanbacteria bacterium]|nr:transposase [Candidatus Gottesmanbacteria bacterium]